MSKIINADLYKSFHRVYVYVLMAVMVGASIFVNSILAYNKIPLESSFGLALSILVFPLFFISMFADIITAEENKEHTMKNTISFGVSRNKFLLRRTSAQYWWQLPSQLLLWLPTQSVRGFFSNQKKMTCPLFFLILPSELAWRCCFTLPPPFLQLFLLL